MWLWRLLVVLVAGGEISQRYRYRDWMYNKITITGLGAKNWLWK
jgi:hypothetical protein